MQFTFCTTSPGGTPISNPGTTNSSDILFGGSGTPGATFVIIHNGALPPVASGTYNVSGAFIQLITDLDPGPHRFELRETQASATTSEWQLNVGATAPLTIDQKAMRLEGLMVRSYVLEGLNGVDAIGNTEVRVASGGQPPYTYRSNSNIAEVDAYGKVTGMSNGSATITVTDAQGAQVQYIVLISNVWGLWLYHTGYPFTYAKYQAHQTQVGNSGLTPTLRAVIQRCYKQPWFNLPATTPNIWTGATPGEVYNNPTGNFFMADLNASQDYGMGFYLLPAVINGANALSDTMDAAEVVVPAPSVTAGLSNASIPVLPLADPGSMSGGVLATQTQAPSFIYCTTLGGTDIPNPGNAPAAGFELGAMGQAGEPLEITDTFNGSTTIVSSPGSVFNPSGRFLQRVHDPAAGVHIMGLRPNASLPSTSNWVLTVGNSNPLTIDLSPLSLDKYSFFNNKGWHYIPQNESSATRAAIGGVPPYVYRSANQNIATVDVNGKVIASRNGTTTITVTDAAGSSLSYTVRVSNVYETITNEGLLTPDEARDWVIRVGGNVDSHVEYLQISYLTNWPRDVFDNRIYPDPLCERWTQIQSLGMAFRQWSGTALGGAYWFWGSSKRMRAITSVPS
ncbi:Ig-like domain-containing protein [Pseudomonas sp. PHC1]|uniref:Ig-like domain-containing protein n=1 Tax=Pseudomonas sp. PHC1 TaxID=3384759 RepID=UPI00396F2B77